jgi:hypothetical protein
LIGAAAGDISCRWQEAAHDDGGEIFAAVIAIGAGSNFETAFSRGGEDM